MGSVGGTSLPWSNARIVLQEEVDRDEDYAPGVVARLYYTPTSHPVVRQSMQGLTPRMTSIPAVALQSLANNRGPDGLLGVIPCESKHSAKLLALCERCHESGEVLVCSLPAADIVLVARHPRTAIRDGLYFLAYATHINAVELCDQLRKEHKVALVLDLDNTLVDATACSIDAEDWDKLDWVATVVHNSGGKAIQAQHAVLPGEDPYSPDVHVMHWRVGRLSCTFRVRVRPGWSDLRAFLTTQRDKFTTFVCSKGKSEYIQLLWEILDPEGILIPREDWPARLTSTFPDTLARAAPKTALTAVGCLSITQPQVPTQLAAPVMCLDDSAEAYAPGHEGNIMYLAEYRPSDLLCADTGNVLRQVVTRLQAYWNATCTADGTFAWQAAQSFGMALMGAMQRNPMESPDALVYLQMRCRKQGEALAHQFTVQGVFAAAGTGCMILDWPPADAEWAAARAAAQAVQQQTDNAGRSGSGGADAMDVLCGLGSLSGGASAGGGEQPPSPAPHDDSINLMGTSADDAAPGGPSLAHADSGSSADMACMAVETA